jgi:diacylglycerol O-acyltransferase / wax synthase
VNDVIVAAMSGAVRSWLLEMGELPSQPLVALVPVSVRADDADAGGDQVQVMLVEVPTNEPDPAVRLSKTHEALVAAKERHRAVPAAARQAADGLLMPIIFKPASLAAMKLSGRAGAASNMVVSNMPGPARPVFIDGRRVEGVFPVGGVVEGFGFSTIVFSYCDELEFGFVLDEGSDADPWRLGAAMQREQAVLHALVEQGSPGRFSPKVSR